VRPLGDRTEYSLELFLHQLITLGEKMISTSLRGIKDILVFSGIGALYSVQLHLPKLQTQALIGIIGISRVANRLLLECVRHSTGNVGRRVKLANRYAFTNASVNIITIMALRSYQLVENRGTVFLGVLALLNISRIKSSGQYPEGFEDLHR
jgi:hypothetical protein